MLPIFEQLDQNEKIALEIAIIHPHKALSNLLPKFYGKGWSQSALYRHRREGADKLISKGLLDREERPTALAFSIIPEPRLKEFTSKLHMEVLRLYKEKTMTETAKFSAEFEVRRMKEDIAKLESSLKTSTEQLESIASNKVQEVIHRFDFLGIDENWVSVLVALNLVEMSMKRKIESFGLRPKGSFKELYDIVTREILVKEKREMIGSSILIKPKHLYDFRSKMDHDGLKVKITEHEADFLIEQASKFINELKIH